MQFTEKEAEDFLEKKGFNVVEREVINKKDRLSKVKSKINFPWAMKASGDIVHKAKAGAIKLNINSLAEAQKAFDELINIQGSNAIMIQETLSGDEIIVGLKKTSEFGHVIMFGRGGSQVEKHRDISFRVLPVTEKDIDNMIKETEIYKTLKDNKINIKEIIKVLKKIEKLAESNKNIAEFDINPLFVNDKKATVVDARILFED